MTSFLNLCGTSALYANMIMKLTSNDNFVNLVSDINENGLDEYNERFIVKAMYQFFDPIIIPYLQKPENKLLFENDKLSKPVKIQTCVVRLVTLMYNMYVTELEKNGLKMMKNKTEIVSDTSSELCTHINVNKVNSCFDVYKILLEYHGLQISQQLTLLIKTMTCKLDDTIEQKFYSSVDNITKQVNDTYMYTPYLYQDKDNSDNDSDSDNDDGDSSNKDSTNNDSKDDTNNDSKDDTNNQVKSPTKRSRDDNNDNDSNDSTDSKKRRNE